MTAAAAAIVSRQQLVLCVDECHLHCGDALGYVWGPQGKRVRLPMTNGQERQTYYGALDVLTGRAFTWSAPGGDSDQTVRFFKALRRRFQGRRMVILWDGASYHRSAEVQAYLQQVNAGGAETAWRIQCVMFAPYAPQQNPMEDVWLAGKTAVRRMWQTLSTFAEVKQGFCAHIEKTIFQFEKLNWYGRLQFI